MRGTALPPMEDVVGAHTANLHIEALVRGRQVDDVQQANILETSPHMQLSLPLHTTPLTRQTPRPSLDTRPSQNVHGLERYLHGSFVGEH